MDDVMIKTFNCLVKTNFDKEKEEKQKSAFQNEEVVFNVGVFSKHLLLNCKVEIISSIKEYIDLFILERVPVSTMDREGADSYYIKDKELIVDMLRPLDALDIFFKASFWTMFSICINSKGKKLKPGNYPIEIKFTDTERNQIVSTTYEIEILKGTLERPNIYYTNWMHYDCISTYYNVKPFTKKYNTILNKFISMAIDHGLNTLYTPLFSAPLDTGINHERPTFQLMIISKQDGKYIFDFSLLKKFIDNARRLGIKNFEFSHLFTQWGANNCPKIIIDNKKCFGWDIASDSKEYLEFLEAFLPELNKFIESNDLIGKCFYHISDEPGKAHLEMYEKLHNFVKPLLTNAIAIDAMSDYDFYEKKLVDIPVIATSSITPFIENKIDNYWVYYCVSQNHSYLSNRFIANPGERTRIIGMQLYINDIKGLLHWGYNFYYSFLSLKKINPFANNDMGGIVPSGDPFSVYPGKNGPLASIRLKYIRQAFYDYSALKKLEEKIGKDKVVSLLEKYGIKKNLVDYPHDPYKLVELRETINHMIVNKK